MENHDKDDILTFYAKGFSTREISEMMHIGKSTVGRVIKDAGIGRDKKPSHHSIIKRARKATLLQDFIPYLDGLVLSDGMIERPSPQGVACAYSQHSVQVEWLNLIAEDFDKNDLGCSVLPEKERKEKQKDSS